MIIPNLIEEECKGKDKEEDSAEPWVNLFEKNRSAVNDMPLNYTAPVFMNEQCITELDEAEVAKET